MYKKLQNKFFKFSCLFAFILMTACSGKVPLIASGVSGPEGLPAEEASFAKFNDLPMPGNSKMNLEKSLVFGAPNTNDFSRFILELPGIGRSLNLANDASSAGKPSGPETPLAISGTLPEHAVISINANKHENLKNLFCNFLYI